MQKASVPPGNPLIDTFLSWADLGDTPGGALKEWLARLGEADLLEEALARFKAHWKGRKALVAVQGPLEAAAERSRNRRIHRWQQDPLRRTLRLCVEITGSASELHPPALQAALAQALLAAGVPLALGLGKTPRPMVQWGHPLPPGVDGLAEWADITLREPLRGSLADLVNPHCGPGIRVLASSEVPNYATPVLELCSVAHWRWACPEDLRERARSILADFEASETYQIDKSGKAEGRKVIKRLEVRPMVLALAWTGPVLHFSTRLAIGEALNPQKLLGGILEVEPSRIQPLTRERVDLRADPRLDQAERFQTKLHNLFEDAVMLEGGGNITLVDDDDDEPLRL